MKTLTIGNKKIGEKYKPFIICELGINHGGSLKLAKKMVDLALRAGADAIKNQLHLPSYEMIDEAKKTVPSNTNKSIYKVIEENLMSFEDEKKLKIYVEKKDMIYLSTPFSFEAAKKLNNIGIKAFKIGSGEFNNLPLISKIIKFKKPMILSTGMNNLKSIKQTVKFLDKNKAKYALLHCKSEYPSDLKNLKLDFINVLKNNFKNTIIGYSDHAEGIIPSISAMAKGAAIIEKHFTDRKKRKGPDIICSMDHKELSFLSEASKVIFLTNGKNKKISKTEKITAKFAFSSVVTIKDIKKGEQLTLKNIWVKRPGTGDFLANKLNSLIGRIAKKNISKNKFINKNDI
jgi:sialic acid synthase SpsE